jgi:hypothetical protein
MDSSKWLDIEQWFMRGIGAALLLAAVLGFYFGTLSNPQNDTMIQGMNIVLALVMAAAGAWALWWSASKERIGKMLEGIKEQGAGISRLLAVVQLIIAALFLLEGTSRGGIVMLLLGAMMLVSAGFFFWRGQQIS